MLVSIPAGGTTVVHDEREVFVTRLFIRVDETKILLSTAVFIAVLFRQLLLTARNRHLEVATP